MIYRILNYNYTNTQKHTHIHIHENLSTYTKLHSINMAIYTWHSSVFGKTTEDLHVPVLNFVSKQS